MTEATKYTTELLKKIYIVGLGQAMAEGSRNSQVAFLRALRTLGWRRSKAYKDFRRAVS